jgi:hypothetical protein
LAILGGGGSLSDEDFFFEWLRGFIDAEGNFFIQIIENRLNADLPPLCLHVDENPLLLKYIYIYIYIYILHKGVGNLGRKLLVLYYFNKIS